MIRFLTGFLVFLLFAYPAEAAKRVALVIGNSQYKFVPALEAPPRDVRLLVDTLRKVGFNSVSLHENLDGQSMRRVLREFSDLAADADLALIYYSGHGVELARRNFMVPVDAKLKKAKDADFEAVELEHFRTAVDGASKLRMVVLDACRNNPFPLEAKDGSRAGRSRGLAEVRPGVNELIAFSAQAGVVADDSAEDGISPFATSFAKWIATPGMDIRFVMGNVRDDVLAKTGTTEDREGPQIPYVESSLGGEQIFLNPAAAIVPPPPPQSGRNDEARLAFVVAGNDINMLNTVAAEFADTTWGKLAAGRVKTLNERREKDVALTAPKAVTSPLPLPPPPGNIPPRRKIIYDRIVGEVEVLDGHPVLTDDKLNSASENKGFSACNARTGEIYVALGYKMKEGWWSEGWWNIAPGKCIPLLPTVLNSRYYYVHAVDDKKYPIWTGVSNMCGRDTAFTISGIEDCEKRGFKTLGFLEVDTGKETKWQVTIN